MHPLAPNLSEATLDELEKKRNELTTNLNRCYTTGRYGMIQQILMLLDDYNQEIQKRHMKIMEQAQKDGQALTERIDIGK